ncbi:MAG: DNA cytosine methyltransferase [Thalassobaculaceae bacterium]|uniref:DNA cytosine methyltransferase n=1 Tax=Roseitalea porphyridii TaxID=1852022 RepID=UPI0032ED5629
MSRRIDARLARLAAGGRPRVLDLFCGCGGISLGFERAGFEILGGVESDLHASRTHRWAFHGDQGDRTPGADAADATDDPAFTLSRMGVDDPKADIDVLVGGPPCQAFARIGRAKLREIAEDPQAHVRDPRAELYRSYLDYVATVEPFAILIENVPDILNYGGRNVAEEICSVLDRQYGYSVRYTLLNAAWYGVPQMRERCFIVAIHRSVRAAFSFPEPQNWIELPSGYRQSRAHALGLMSGLFGGDTYFSDIREPHPGLPAAVTAEQALGDLPTITEHLRDTVAEGRRPIGTPVAYREDAPASDYARLMRSWNNRTAGTSTDAHVTRRLPRDYRIFAAMNEGDEYPAARRTAERLFLEHVERETEAGRSFPAPGSALWEAERDRFVPPYDPAKFTNKWWKLRRDLPSRTLTAHIGKDTYSHIHYDSHQARTITVREAARLQSFPDAFRFSGAMNAAFRQIGNAVPPLLAAAVAGEIRRTLEQASSLFRPKAAAG